jgi:hypothetical protein
VVEGYTKGIHTLKEKEQEEELEKEKEIKSSYADNVTLSEKEYTKLVNKYGKRVADASVTKLSAAKSAKGYKYKSDYAAILNWVVGEVIKNGGVPAATAQAKTAAGSRVCSKCGYVNNHSGGMCLGCRTVIVPRMGDDE